MTQPLEPHRPALTGLCYRMLGSVAEADDAVQETMLRAWRRMDGFDGRSELSTWLYRIATNVCLDQLRSRRRRGLPVLERSCGTPEDELAPQAPTSWLEPLPDALSIPSEAAPERQVEMRQSLRLAFVAALQHLPPKQRAALLLKDVLGFSATEIADTLGMTTAAVNSALQRARQTMAERRKRPASAGTLTEQQRRLVDDYVEAFHHYDVDRLVGLLREDGTMSMPPFALWLRGRKHVAQWLRGRGRECEGSRLVPTAANGSVAFGQYRRAAEGHHAWSLIVLELAPDAIASMTYFLDVETLFPHFDLPLDLPPDHR